MKLRFYLRGLGIGIVVTALFMSLSGGRAQALTDEQIIARAETLGMVQEDKVLLNADKKEPEEPAAAEPESVPEESAEEAVPAEPTAEVTNEAPEAAEPEAETPKPETPKPETEQTAEAADDTASTENTANAQDSPFILEIASGSSSDTVSALLQKGGLISNAAEFDDYLCDNHYDNRIVAGRHTIPAGADYEAIAKIITTK